MNLNKNAIAKVNVGGRGGKEGIFAPVLTEYRRVSESLYDFVHVKDSSKVEIKKQQNLQWFDAGKYHDLTVDQKNIMMMFVNHVKGSVKSIYTISLGEFIDTLCSDSSYQEDGWTKENIKACHVQKIAFPRMQVKVPLKVLDFVERYPNQVSKVY